MIAEERRLQRWRGYTPKTGMLISSNGMNEIEGLAFKCLGILKTLMARNFSFTNDQAITRLMEDYAGTRTLKHRQSGTSKTYEIYGVPPTWFSQIEDDFKSGFFKKR